MINGPAPTGYPIVNYEYAIVKTTQSNAVQAEDIRAFLHWIVHTGQDATTYLDAGRLPAAAVQHRVPVRQADREDRQLARWPHQHQRCTRRGKRAPARFPAGSAP